ISNFIGRYHIVIFVVFSLGGLAIALSYLNQVINTSLDANGYTSTANSVSFDDATIGKLRALKTTGETTEKLQMSGRTNPFVE
ncbi:MAG: hypothetical protein ABJA64_01050, partial [Candidatus Saccharibacteria bacterium]